MGLLTKEKSKQKRKSVNIQNNSIELFPDLNTGLHHQKIIKNKLRND